MEIVFKPVNFIRDKALNICWSLQVLKSVGASFGEVRWEHRGQMMKHVIIKPFMVSKGKFVPEFGTEKWFTYFVF